MVKKKSGAKGKRNVIREVSGSSPKEEQKARGPEPEKPRMPQRVQERDPGGFGVIKTVAGVVIVLIIGSVVLFNQSGGRESARGDKQPGELCEETMECASGSICFSYKGGDRRCHQRCGQDKACEPGQTCVSASEKKRRKGIRVADICVDNARL